MVQNAECAGVFTGRHPFTPRLTLTLREVLAWVQAKRQELTMLLKVGDLAKRCGLTVRMLHHYDSIGLLTPSARSDSGYRLYDKADIARLHQIQALRRFGMSLADVGAFLASPDVPLTTIMERQIAMLDQQITQASVLRDRLTRLHDQLMRKEEPELAEWLTTLEWMTMKSGVGLFTYKSVTALLPGAGCPSIDWQSLGKEPVA